MQIVAQTPPPGSPKQGNKQDRSEQIRIEDVPNQQQAITFAGTNSDPNVSKHICQESSPPATTNERPTIDVSMANMKRPKHKHGAVSHGNSILGNQRPQMNNFMGGFSEAGASMQQRRSSGSVANSNDADAPISPTGSEHLPDRIQNPDMVIPINKNSEDPSFTASRALIESIQNSESERNESIRAGSIRNESVKDSLRD